MRPLIITLKDGRVCKYRTAALYGLWIALHGGLENIKKITYRRFLIRRTVYESKESIV